MKIVPNIEQKKYLLIQKLLPVEVNFLTHFRPIIPGSYKAKRVDSANQLRSTYKQNKNHDNIILNRKIGTSQTWGIFFL